MPRPINVVIDISHHQEDVDFKKIKAAGIVGVIHKATEGFTFIDQRYDERRQEALDQDLLWGAYHFGIGGDGQDQADHFLNTVDPSETILIVLDYEQNPVGPTMSLNQARDFVSHIEAVTERFP